MRRATRIYPTYWLLSPPLVALAIVAPSFINSSVQTPISLWRSFFLIPDTTVPLLAVGWTLVHELYFYLVFSIFLALRIPILVGVVGWGVILLLIVATFPDQLAIFPLVTRGDKPFDSRIYDGIDGWCSLDERLGGGRNLGRRRRTRRADAFDHPYSTDTVTFDQPTYRRLARCDIWSSVGTARLHDHWSRAAAPIITTQDVDGGAWRLVVLHLPRPCLVISAVGRMLFLFAPNGGVSASVTLIAVGLVAARSRRSRRTYAF